MDLPKITKFSQVDIDSPTSLVAVAGFEDRARAIFEEFSRRDDASLISSATSIQYEPFNSRNNINALKKGLSSLGISDDSTQSMVFDRHDPNSFESDFSDFLDSISENHVILDVSGMSKLLIIISLQILAEKDFSVTIYYAEADKYHPREDEYTKKLQSSEDSDRTPAFLTNGIYDIVTTRGLSSALGSDQSMVVVAFPTFNHQELMALTSELSPAQLVSIQGSPRMEKNQWRKESIRELNEGVESHIQVDWRETSTFNYRQTVEVLNHVYEDYSDKYRIVLAPTGSKLQTVGCHLFKYQHPDIQVVYPVTREFSETYSEGWDNTWGIVFESLDDAIITENEKYQQKISNLRSKIDEMNDTMDSV
ncbi:hypothetical protein HYG81_13645 [Natrinema zhouii]|uniref:Uncharacterized protein n=1 Tax=Natrinema zhouii TaxID=1710539 RepID=A0A7D6CNU4_9EURY|nr:hypothetical protein [Natrinema zhouii]QLK25129.1 hypothetical protein HYG81_13645 [Natrinema zhouii]